MQTMTIRQLQRASAGQLAEMGECVITSDGEPVARLVPYISQAVSLAPIEPQDKLTMAEWIARQRELGRR